MTKIPELHPILRAWLLEEAVGWYATAVAVSASAGDERPVSLAWHDRSGVLIPLTGDEESVTIGYAPAREEG
jgi:hypothetical protein